MKLSEMVMPEVVYYLEQCNFTDDEKSLFLKRTKDIPFEKCAELMNVSTATVYRINKRIQRKMGAVNESSVEKGKLQNLSCR